MSQPNRGCPQLANQIHIFFVMFGQKRIAESPSVLMAGNTAQRIRFAVQNKALFGIDTETAAPESSGHTVKHFAVFPQLGTGSIQIRTFSSVPKVYLRNFHGDFGTVGGTDRFGNVLAVSVLQTVKKGLSLFYGI